MEKQIEKDLTEIFDEEYGKRCLITPRFVAERLIEKGYRKQSDVAREIFAEIGKILTAKYNSIQAGCHHRMRFGNADTPQGMKELGELSGVRQVIAEIKAFEKKYLEDDNDS